MLPDRCYDCYGRRCWCRRWAIARFAPVYCASSFGRCCCCRTAGRRQAENARSQMPIWKQPRTNVTAKRRNVRAMSSVASKHMDVHIHVRTHTPTLVENYVRSIYPSVRPSIRLSVYRRGISVQATCSRHICIRRYPWASKVSARERRQPLVLSALATEVRVFATRSSRDYI